MMNTQKKQFIYCNNEFDVLSQVILCLPKFMSIEDVINETQKHHINNNIDVKKAMFQFRNFKDVLMANNVEVTYLQEKPELPEQVFVRDIGFVLKDNFFITNMKYSIRKNEKNALIDHLNYRGIPFYSMKSGPIEGGDLFINGDELWIGISKRTSTSAVREISSYFPDYNINIVELSDKVLHLDCTFNFLSSNDVILCPAGIKDKKMLNHIRNRFNVIEISELEQQKLACNFLNLGKNKIITQSSTTETNNILRNLGYEVIEIDISEITKSGGGFRCMTLPIYRNRV